MTMRVLALVAALLCASSLLLASPVEAENLPTRELPRGTDAHRGLPTFFRSSAGTTWIQVHLPGTSPCDSGLTSAGGDIHDPDFETQTVDDVWCFEGVGGDSTWPAGPGGTSQDDWQHWSRAMPPVPEPSRWHVTTLFGDDHTGVFNAWCGCDSMGTNPGCADVAFWVNKTGYGAVWRQGLYLDLSTLNAEQGGTLSFSLRYDTECIYDYLYLEYLDETTGQWPAMTDSLAADGTQVGTRAIFNGVSGNPDTADICDNGTGGPDDGNYFDTGASNPSGEGRYYGNSIWYHDVTFPLPRVPNLKIRWRVMTDLSGSDEDGRLDSDGMAAIDNIVVTFANAAADTVTDDFEFGDFDHARLNGVPTAGFWSSGPAGNTYDGWHLTFDPRYKNRGNTCTFSSDWMWAAKPDTSPISENSFSFLLVTPVIPTDGWTGALIRYSVYLCAPVERYDRAVFQYRRYDSDVGLWTPWHLLSPYFYWGPCDGWAMDQAWPLTPFLGTSTDSLQITFQLLDMSEPNQISWGQHGSVQFLVDNVAIGSYDARTTYFYGLEANGLFAETFSRCDPSHTPFLTNAELGRWIGIPGGWRLFAVRDSLALSITDSDGLSTGTVDLCWRADAGPRTGWEAWKSKPMDFAQQDETRPPGEGVYRGIIGDDAGGAEDYSGSAGDGLIWMAGQTVQYYVKVVDDLSNEATWPTGASDPVNPFYQAFTILPFNIDIDGNVVTTFEPNGDPEGICLLLVDDGARALDFEHSAGFDPSGGAGFGNFIDPVYVSIETLVERGLAALYGGSPEDPHWDTYHVVGVGTNHQAEPPGVSDVGAGLGAYMTDALTPYYDALIWLNGDMDGYTYFAEETRLELAAYLDVGGTLLSTGDGVAFDLGSGGNGVDVDFLSTYLGTSFPHGADDATERRSLNIAGEAGTSLDGVRLGIYGECPWRRNFDRLTLAPPAVGSANMILATYAEGGTYDNGRPAIIKNVRTVYGGVAVHTGFGIDALISDASRACLLGSILANDFGLPVTNAVACLQSGVPAPVVPGASVFSLAAAAPSPFLDVTRIAFTLPVRTHVSLEVFNVLGQRVRTLVDEVLEADTHVRPWDGRSDDGTGVSSGIYFYRMVAGDYRATRKVVLLK